ncbi:2-keto-4-pentenoate hydratase/2-oxohepta-3-ene-1,7-dioic acid hydratase in catechol pathway [Paenibacillus taihuensis]|uniref:2-keto-4-pentenoate hydratase/2-oxohepta-3-ene-1,7-dioic acid hydratase in catechol pathway n=1 Tax=Paenibacillus taihuensis TaxID=1156355 RepID=A0A3D9SAV8_9BACL|nr:fumarylacetoacetate hydrolase family protein [Paenibacillus taihuensis]REE86199.1 2-keto-4-pentenoate hydratase/2-oxohepta-3-ene-1,7-dioic acid hydratase in catechol pathway [Paenibacillus taihuensis]
MRLMACEAAGRIFVGVEKDGGVVPTSYVTMKELVQDGEEGLAKVRQEAAAGEVVTAGYRVLAPIANPGKVLCGGINYLNHKEENPKAVFPTRPSVFSKLPTAIIGPGEHIVLPYADCQADYEVELAFVIGKRAKGVKKEEALDYIFGYTALNDVSGRELQFALQHEIIGKGIDTFCPLGPVIVTRDEIADPNKLQIRSYVNGELRQNANTELMLFHVPTLIEAITAYITLEPGDIISTGTPAGVGTFRNPPVYLAPGDYVAVEIEGIGKLENRVVAGW